MAEEMKLANKHDILATKEVQKQSMLSNEIQLSPKLVSQVFPETRSRYLDQEANSSNSLSQNQPLRKQLHIISQPGKKCIAPQGLLAGGSPSNRIHISKGHVASNHPQSSVGLLRLLPKE